MFIMDDIYNIDPKFDVLFREILKYNKNDNCADCKSEYISNVNCYFKITLCELCGFVHELLPLPLNDLKPINYRWYGLSDVTIIKSINNSETNEKLLHMIPHHYQDIDKHSPLVLRKYFIFAKYSNKFVYKEDSEFISHEIQYVKEGILFKRRKEEDRYSPRYFQLLENGWMKYYQNVKPIGEAKSIIPIEKLDIYLVPEKMDIETGMQMTFSENNSVRDIYIYAAAEFPMEIIEWYHVIRGAKLQKLKKKYPTTPEICLNRLISGVIVREGWMEKSGSKSSDILRRRWFTLIEKPLFLYTQWILRYYKYPLDDRPKGELYLGKHSDGYEITTGKTFSGKKSDEHTFTLVTPNRKYDFVADDPRERHYWMRDINKALLRAN